MSEYTDVRNEISRKMLEARNITATFKDKSARLLDEMAMVMQTVRNAPKSSAWDDLLVRFITKKPHTSL